MELEKEIHLEMFPHCHLFHSDDEEEELKGNEQEKAVVDVDDSDSDGDISMEDQSC